MKATELAQLLLESGEIPKQFEPHLRLQLSKPLIENHEITPNDHLWYLRTQQIREQNSLGRPHRELGRKESIPQLQALPLDAKTIHGTFTTEDCFVTVTATQDFKYVCAIFAYQIELPSGGLPDV
jgi:hypothetical protein